MRKLSLAVAVLGACLALSFLPHAPAVGDVSGVGGGEASHSAGQTPFIGTFLIEMEIAGLPPLLVLSQVHADGTALIIDQSDAGYGGFLDLDSPQLGSWKRTGPFQATIVTLFFNFDNPGGLPATVTRVTHVCNFDVGFDTGEGVSTLRLYDVSAGEDPLDPNQGIFDSEIPWTMRRLVP